MDKKPAVYILASERNGTLYIGVTSDLIKRVREHREGVVDGFTKKYSVHKLVYFELFDDMENAIIREKGTGQASLHFTSFPRRRESSLHQRDSRLRAFAGMTTVKIKPKILIGPQNFYEPFFFSMALV